MSAELNAAPPTSENVQTSVASSKCQVTQSNLRSPPCGGMVENRASGGFSRPLLLLTRRTAASPDDVLLTHFVDVELLGACRDLVEGLIEIDHRRLRKARVVDT